MNTPPTHYARYKALYLKHRKLGQARNRIGSDLASKLDPHRTLDEVGAILGITGSRVEQIQNQALYKIARAFHLEVKQHHEAQNN